jgi:alpha-ketoglutaric semialdehyde dehydrogenase
VLRHLRREGDLLTAVDSPARPAGLNYVGGCWVESAGGETYSKHSPMRPAEVTGVFQSSSEADARAAVAAAHAAYESWGRLPMARRAAHLSAAAAVLEARTEQVAVDMSTEMGKPLREARGEAARAAQILRFAAGEAFRSVGESFEQSASGQQVVTRRRPLGVVALITPWNFPLAIPVWKLAPALVYGNTVVLKLAYESPRTGLHLAEAFAEADLPPGVLNVLTGRGSTVGAALVRDPRVRAISFTGSVATGNAVRDEATGLGKRVQLELGGHNPLIVMADGDLTRAVEAAYAGAYWSAGQKCTATRRIYVQDAAYDAFRERLLERIASGKVGDPLDPEVEVGPIVNESQFTEVAEAIERGREQGGTLVTGGVREGAGGYLIEPVLFENVADDAFLSCQEVFGPVASLYRFATLDEALARANAVEYGLSAAIFTSSLAAATRFGAEAQAGLLHVNSQTAGAEVHVPFGGIKASGFGPHEQGRAALEFYTETVTLYIDP